MPEPRGAFSIEYEEPRGPRKRRRYTPIERGTPGTWWVTVEEKTHCGWRILSRDRVDDVALEIDANAVRTEAEP